MPESTDRSAGRSGTRGVPREVRAATILEAAAHEFGEHGYAGAQVAGIATRSGVSKALVLAYFQSKEKLFIACVEKAGPLVFDAVDAAFAQPRPTPADSMSLFSRSASRVINNIVGALEGRVGYWALLYDRTVPDGAGRRAARAQRRRLREQAAGEIVGVLRLAGLRDPQEFTAAVMMWESMVSGLMTWWRLQPDLPAADVAAVADRILVAWSTPAPSHHHETETP